MFGKTGARQWMAKEVWIAAAVGDGANDVEMLRAARLGVAFYGKPLAREAADAEINHTGLDSLLFFQGIARADFALQDDEPD